MIHIRRLLVTLMLSSLGLVVYGMEKEHSAFSQLPSELKRYIASLLLEKTIGYNYVFFKKIYIDNSIYSVAFSPDGKTILTGSLDKTAQLWNIESCELLKQFTGHTGIVYSAAFSPDGKTVLTGSLDKTARLWKVETGKEIKQFTGHTKGISSVAFSPDGKTILTGSRDGTVIVWDRDSCKKLREFQASDNEESISMAFSLDSEIVVTRSEDSTARLWDIKTRELLKKFKVQINNADSVAFSSDGKTILTGSKDTACIWNIDDCMPIKEFVGHTDVILSVAFSPDGKTILTGSRDKTTRLWHIQSGAQLKKFKRSYGGSITSLAFSYDGEMIATGAADLIMVYKHSKESPEEIKERFKQMDQTIQKEYEEKVTLLFKNNG